MKRNPANFKTLWILSMFGLALAFLLPGVRICPELCLEEVIVADKNLTLMEVEVHHQPIRTMGTAAQAKTEPERFQFCQHRY